MMDEELQERYGRGLPPDLPDHVWKDRIKRCRALMEKKGLDVFLVYSGGQALTGEGQWARYFANYVQPIWNSEAFVLIPLRGEPTLIINYPFYVDRAKEMSNVKDIRSYKFFGANLYTSTKYGDFEALLKAILKEKGLEKCKIGLGRQGMQGDYMPALLDQAIKRACDGLELEDASDILWELIAVKTDYDIQMIRKSCEIDCLALKAAFDVMEEGKSGCDACAAFIIAAGERGAEFPGVYPTNWHFSVKPGDTPNRAFWITAKKFKKGEIIPIDSGTMYQGYPHDMGRTAVIGAPSKLHQRMHEANMAAQEAMMDALKPGVKASELSKINFDVAKKFGFERIHDLQGHGIGILENEPPIITPWSDIIIKEGMILNLEQVVCVKNVGSSLVEDTFLVTKNGYEWLTDKMEKGLHIR